ncbi:MAG: hypothetical protein EPO47_12135 [Rugosibacter sp.]|nr:MAG: hypothetical protein EPO60_05305 [Rugosibacter sp.]TBR07017.1 MAG: hypothetical protein EPO47_12135 [Rugosibacter sp.]
MCGVALCPFQVLREWLVERIKDWLTDIETPPLPSGDFAENFARSRAATVALAVGCVSPKIFAARPIVMQVLMKRSSIQPSALGLPLTWACIMAH